MRRVLAMVMGLVVGFGAACGSSDPGTPQRAEPTDDELALFCERYLENSNLSNLDLMASLVEVAPPGYAEILERESVRGGSIEDTEAVHALFDRCDALAGG